MLVKVINRCPSIFILKQLHIFVLCTFSISLFSSSFENFEYSKTSINFRDNQSFFFIENKGQLKDSDGNHANDVFYYANLKNLNIYFKKDALVYEFIKPIAQESTERRANDIAINSNPIEVFEEHYRMDMMFVNSNCNLKIKAFDKKSAVHHYYYGTDLFQNVSLFSKIIYENIYEGIDLVFYIGGKDFELKYDFVVHENAKPEQIKISYEGAEKIQIDSDGNLIVETPLGIIKELAPFTYQTINSEQKEVKSQFVIDKDYVSFSLEKYRSNQTLIIDPSVLIWSTYYGASGSVEMGEHIVNDQNGNIFVTGKTNGTNFPTSVGAFQVNFAGTQDGFVLKFDSNGNRLWASYIGGNRSDNLRSCASDNQGNLFITGTTLSLNFPTINPGGGAYFQSTNFATTNNINNPTAYLAKFNNSGSLTWSTYLGGNLGENGIDVWIDNGNNLIVTGSSASSDFPVTSGAFQAINAGPIIGTSIFGDAYVGKFSNAGVLQWLTFLGGSQDELGYGVTTDDNNNIYATGWSVSSNFPSSAGAFQTTYGGGSGDAFVVKYSPTGARLWSTFYGGNTEERGIDCVVSEQFLYFTGYTSGNLPGPSTGVFQPNYAGGIGDGYIAKFQLESSNTQVVWRTYFGGSGDDGYDEITKDNDGNIIFCGYTSSANYPVSPHAFQTTHGGGYDGCITTLNKDGELICSSYFGGSQTDNAYGLASGANGDIFVTGFTQSSTAQGFQTTPGAFQQEKAAGQDAYIARLSLIPPLPIALFEALPSSGCAPLTVNFTNTSQSLRTCISDNQYSWTFEGGIPASSNLENPPSVLFANSGVFPVTLTVTNLSGSHTFTLEINVTGNVMPAWSLPDTLCQNSDVLNLNSLLSETSSGVWSGQGVVNAVFNPASLSGDIDITYTIGETPCQVQETQTIFIKQNLNSSWASPSNICSSSTPINLNQYITGNSGGVWSGNGVNNGTFNPNGLSGTIEITYKVGNGLCASTTVQSIEIIEQADASWTQPTSICKGENIDLSTLLTGTAGGVWSGQGVQNGIFNSSNLSGTIPLTYTVGSGDCAAFLIQNIQIIETAPPNISPEFYFCPPDQFPLMNTINSVGTIHWYDDVNLSNLIHTGSDYQPSEASGLSFWLTQTIDGCVSESVLTTLIQENAIIAQIEPNGVITICQGQTVELTSNHLSGNLWSTGETTQTITVANPGVVSLTVTGVCNVSTSEVTIIVEDLEVDFEALPASGPAPLEVDINNLSSNSSFCNWLINNSPNQAPANGFITFNEQGTYIITLSCTSLNGCKKEATKIVNVGESDFAIYVPNTITPNGDGLNDLFKVYGFGISSINVKIYNRWGEMIYFWDDLDGGWDGTYKNQMVQQGVYSYIINGIDENKNKFKKIGSVTVLSEY